MTDADKSGLQSDRNDRWFAISPPLAEAIGWVVLRSAMLDDLLAEILDHMVNSDVTARLLSGQTSEWLAEAVLRALGDADHYKTAYGAEKHAELYALMSEARSLRDKRNDVVHGTWLDWAVDRERIKPRPWGGKIDEKTLFCTRDRRLRYSQESAFTIGDIHQLADEYDSLARRLAALYRSMEPGSADLPRW